MAPAAFLAATLAFALGAMLLLWGLSLRRRDVSIVDVWWGPGFAALAWLGLALAGGPHPRRLLLAALVTLWGLRLGGYLLWRSWGEPEDARYRAMRRRHGARFAGVSLGTVFLLQGVLQWTVALPVHLAMLRPGPESLGAWDALGAALVLAGVFFESVGDAQLAAFKADPAHEGRVLDRGLWRYTRHPNYFGDFLVWWGVLAVALATPWGWIGVLGPALMTFLLLRVSGVALLERSIGRRRPAYEAYRRRTNAFFPGPPKAPRDADGGPA